MELVKIIDGKPCTSSKLIAQYFNKPHRNVLKAISNLGCTEEFNRCNFLPMFSKDNYGREECEFTITQDGFTFLIMRFTGRKVAKVKKDFLLEFNCLDAIIRNQQLLVRNTSTLKRNFGIQPIASCKHIKGITLEEWGIFIAVCGLVITIWVEIINPIIRC